MSFNLNLFIQMKIENGLKRFNRIIGRNALCFSFFLAGFLPYKALFLFVKTVLMLLFYYSNSRLVRNARDSVNTAYGEEKTAGQRETLVKQSFENLARVIAEDIYYIKHWPLILSRADIEGEEHLKKALSKGKGVVAVTAHFGNFPLMISWLAYRGYHVSVLMRRPRDQKMGDFIKETVGRMGTKVIFTLPVKECIQASIKTLRNNEILFVLLDQNYGADARVFVDFFGKAAATGASPITFALRTGAAVVPIFCTEGQHGRYRIVVEPEQVMAVDPGNGECLKKNVQLLTSIIETRIRQNPSLWSWMHRRWKSKNRRVAQETIS